MLIMKLTCKRRIRRGHSAPQIALNRTVWADPLEGLTGCGAVQAGYRH